MWPQTALLLLPQPLMSTVGKGGVDGAKGDCWPLWPWEGVEAAEYEGGEQRWTVLGEPRFDCPFSIAARIQRFGKR